MPDMNLELRVYRKTSFFISHFVWTSTDFVHGVEKMNRPKIADAVTVNVYKIIGRKGAPENERLQAWTQDHVKPTHDG